MTAQNAYSDIDFGAVGGWDKAGINAKCQRLYDGLELPAHSEQLFVEAELTYTYAHQNSTVPIHLPVAMFKNASPVDIQATMNRWFTSVNPSTNSAKLEFSARVYFGERTVLCIGRGTVC